jgi:cytidylate kinase
MIIAIDGPAGSGKSSTARAVAKELGFRHLDSGAFYRALTYAAMQRGIPAAEWPRLDAARLESFHISAEPADSGFRMLLGGSDISGPIRRAEVNALVSAMARLPAVRTWLLNTLRESAKATDLVADGRDMGTIVFPDADLKIFLVADPDVRAKRRLEQMGLLTDEESVADEVSRIQERDRADSSRDVAPLRQAEDAVLLDTTHLAFREQVTRIAELARDTMRR